MLICPILQCCVFALVSLRIRIKLIFSTRIRIQIQVAKPMRIHAYPEVQNPFRMAGNQVYLLIMVNFHATGSGSAFLIQTRIQDSQINADPDSQHGYFDP